MPVIPPSIGVRFQFFAQLQSLQPQRDRQPKVRTLCPPRLSSLYADKLVTRLTL